MSLASRSIAFDKRRAESYDRTRSLSPERELPALADRRQPSLDEWIQEARLWLRGRAAPPDKGQTDFALKAVREWAHAGLGSSGGTLFIERLIIWHAYDLG
jgi:hypothetical protein